MSFVGRKPVFFAAAVFAVLLAGLALSGCVGGGNPDYSASPSPDPTIQQQSGDADLDSVAEGVNSLDGTASYLDDGDIDPSYLDATG